MKKIQKKYEGLCSACNIMYLLFTWHCPQNSDDPIMSLFVQWIFFARYTGSYWGHACTTLFCTCSAHIWYLSTCLKKARTQNGYTCMRMGTSISVKLWLRRSFWKNDRCFDSQSWICFLCMLFRKGRELTLQHTQGLLTHSRQDFKSHILVISKSILTFVPH